MFASRLARTLMALGAAVGILAVAILALEVQVNLPDWIVRVAMIKLAFIAAAGLLAGGALLGRHAKSRSLTEDPAEQLGAGAAETLAQRRSVSQQTIPRRPETPE